MGNRGVPSMIIIVAGVFNVKHLPCMGGKRRVVKITFNSPQR
jgi:hypothetical protein